MGIKTVGLWLVRLSPPSEKPPHHMGIKTAMGQRVVVLHPLKNLPTTWGLRPDVAVGGPSYLMSSEKPPHHMGIKTRAYARYGYGIQPSEKPPHHMGIKTRRSTVHPHPRLLALKNLPTTWGLRPV